MTEVHSEPPEIDTFTDPDNKEERTATTNRKPVVAAIGVLAATIVATVTTTLAAWTGAQEDGANQSRQLWGAYSLAQTLNNDASSAAGNQSAADVTENGWRAYFLQQEAAQAHDPSVRQALTAEAAVATAQARGEQQAPTDTALGPPTPGGSGWCHPVPAYLKGNCGAELAASYGFAATGWLRKERSYIAILSILAISLFLFALTRSIGQPAMQSMFLVVATVFLGVALAWLLVEPFVRPVVQPSGPAVVSYERGYAILAATDAQGSITTSQLAAARTALRTAVGDDPDLPDAWTQLGVTLTFRADGRLVPGNCATVEHALTMAVDLRGGSIDFDNLGLGQLYCRQFTASAADFRRALALDPSDDLAMASLAEEQLATGRFDKAATTMDSSICQMSQLCSKQGQVRGSAFRDTWFAEVRRGQQVLAQLGVPSYDLNPFYQQLVDDDQVLFDAFDASSSIPPSTVHGARITHVTLDRVPGPAGAPAPVQVGFDYTGLRRHDLVALTWYRSCDDPFGSCQTGLGALPTDAWTVGTAAAPTRGGGHFTVAPDYLAPGDYYFELSVNGTSVAGPTAARVPVP